jgi:hypothetical protein
MKARPGVTLVEVMLAGSIAAISTLALMGSLVVIARVSRENTQMLAAEAYAWDTAWTWLNKSYENLSYSDEWHPSAQGAETTISDADCHALNVWPGSPAKCYVRVKALTGEDVASPPHGVAGTTWKEIQVDVEWGPSGARKRLNAFATDARIPIYVTKCSIERGGD